MRLLSALFYTSALFASARLYAASPYAAINVSVNSSGDLTYTYNMMGQRQSNGQGQSIEWGLADKPVKIETVDSQGNTATERFDYGTRGQRYLRTHADDDSKTLYVGSLEYRIDSNGRIERKVYIRNGSYSPVAIVGTSDASFEYSYFLRDHLGSALMAVDDSGNKIISESHGRYDPWGQPWNVEGVAVDKLKEDSRGFTGHENIASAGLIHMNGRVYDPIIGQFIGPDRFIQNASRGVGLNRYAYIGNSPTNGTDPSGWAFELHINKVEHIVENGVNITRRTGNAALHIAGETGVVDIAAASIDNFQFRQDFTNDYDRPARLTTLSMTHPSLSFEVESAFNVQTEATSIHLNRFHYDADGIRDNVPELYQGAAELISNANPGLEVDNLNELGLERYSKHKDAIVRAKIMLGMTESMFQHAMEPMLQFTSIPNINLFELRMPGLDLISHEPMIQQAGLLIKQAGENAGFLHVPVEAGGDIAMFVDNEDQIISTKIFFQRPPD